MKHRTLLIAVAILALASLSCGLLGGGEDADTPQSDTGSGGDEGAPPASSDEGAPDIASLEELNSYRLRMTWKAQNEDGSEGATVVITQEWVKGPPEASHLSMSATEVGDETMMPPLEIITIGDSAWMKVDDGWVQMGAVDGEDMTEPWLAMGDMANAEGLSLVGQETVNGVRAKHYASTGDGSFAFVAPEEGGTVKVEAEGEVWVADQSDLPSVLVRQRAKIKGGLFPMPVAGGQSPRGDEVAIIFLEYDVTDINTAIVINPPGEFSEMPGLPPAGETPGSELPASGTSEAPSDLPPPPAETQTQVRAVDSMVMHYIPPGPFIMGDDASPYVFERPTHLVYLDGFWMDETEVTNAQYRLCVEAGACLEPSEAWANPDWNGDPQPVLVNWSGAGAYCQWAGGRLPTEAEWEKGARGTDGRLWPWGNTFESNYANLSGPDDGYNAPAPVGSFPAGASPYGLLDMAGNAAEWVADWFAEDYYGQSPPQNPTGPASGTRRVIRGTISNAGGGPEKCRTVARHSSEPEAPRYIYGFRCASTTQP